MAEKINIATIGVDVNDFITSATSARKEIEKLTEANKLLKTSTGDNTQAIIQNEIELKKQKEVYNQSINSAKLLQTATNELSQAITTEGKSVQQVIQDRNKLIGLAKNIKGSTDEEIALRSRLNTAIDNQTNFIRANQSEYSKSKDSIGEYKQAISTLSPTLAGYIDRLTQTKEGLVQAKNALVTQATALNGSATATNTTSKALGLFRIALASTGIGAIIVVLGSLITYLSTTQAGIDKVNSVLQPLKAITQALIGVMQNLGEVIFNTGQTMLKAFLQPKVILMDLVNFVQNNVTNRFKAFGVILEAIQKRDFKQLANGLIQVGTGVTNATDKVNKVTTAIGNTAKATGKFLEDNAKKGARIAQLTKEIELAQLRFNANQIKFGDEIDRLNLISKDTSRSFKEREQASRQIIALSKANGEEEAKITAKKIEQLKIQQSLNDTDRTGKQELIALQVQLDDQKDRGIEAEREQIRVISGAKKEAATQEQAQIQSNKQAKEKAIQDQKKAEEDAYNRNIQRLNEELDLFVNQQGIKAQTKQQELKLAQDISERQKVILQEQLEAGKISQTAYQNEILKLDQNVLKAQTDLAIENALIQSDLQKQKVNQQILNEQEKNNQLLEIEKEYQKQRLEQGVISETEYNTTINALNEENRLANLELENQRKEIDNENRLSIQADTIAEEDEKQRQELERRKQIELANAEKTGADKNLIEAKYKQFSEDLEMQLLDQKLNLAKDGLNALSDVLGKESKAGKAVAVAQSLINTYQGITKALTLPFPANIVAASTTAITGFKAVKDITATKVPSVPKAERGMLIGGSPHSMGGTMIEAERGEAIINKNSVAKFRPLLSSINQMGGGVGFGATATTQNSLINYDLMAKSFEGAISKMPPPQVAVTEINQVNRNYTKVLERANI